MAELLIIALFTCILLIGISWFFSKRNSPLQYIIPMIVVLISIVFIIISFFVGDWNGLAIGALAFAIFIGSALALIVSAMIANTRELKKIIK